MKIIAPHQIKMALILFSAIGLFAGSKPSLASSLDVINYHLTIHPDIQEKSITGTVTIKFKKPIDRDTVVLSAGNLQIDRVIGEHVQSFKKTGSRLVIKLAEAKDKVYQITIRYHGSPVRGLLFNTDLGQAHTVFFTSHWMICNEDPSDKATFKLDIMVPKGKQCIASGELEGKLVKEDKTLFQWNQNYETPAYTYGFAIGSFNEVTEQAGDTKLRYYAKGMSEEKLQTVFKETRNILQFFELKSGIKYVQKTYSQIFIGSSYQEMSGLAVFNPTYASAVLKDSSEIHLTSHELAHQWWGNNITCKSFSHFWLNEAFAVYMATAFNEYKFGIRKYLADISIYKKIYEDLVARGKDKPLVFRIWEPTKDNRHVVYYKGAYVLHLLRQRIGDDNFWKGIQLYSQRHFGKSVETNDFKVSMEEAANTSLDGFFNQWVYAL